MARFIELTGIDTRREREARENGRTIQYTTAIAPALPDPSARFEGLDYDDLERPLPTTVAVPIYPIQVAIEHVREFYARKGNAVGTRLVFINGSATIVKEGFEEVKAAFNRFNN